MARNRHRPPIDAPAVAVVLSFMIQSSSLSAEARASAAKPESSIYQGMCCAQITKKNSCGASPRAHDDIRYPRSGRAIRSAGRGGSGVGAAVEEAVAGYVESAGDRTGEHSSWSRGVGQANG
jgi:hypothetical protein